MFLENLKFIFDKYHALEFSQKVFISIRYITCPWNKILPLINDNSSILDIGCGHGLFLNLIKKQTKNVHCVGYDHDSVKMDQAKLSSNSIEFLTLDEIDKIPKHSFDFVSIIDVLYSVPINDWDSVINEAYEFLKPNGTLIVKETVNKPKLKYWFCLMQEILAIKILRYTKGEFPNLVSVGYYLEKLNVREFTNINHYSISKYYLWPHYIFIAKK